MLKNFTLIIALLLTSLAQAQKETSIRHIDILAYDSDGELYFYTQKQKDKFLELEFKSQEDENVDRNTEVSYPKIGLINLIFYSHFCKSLFNCF